jgi:hypothetical protein
MKSRLTFPRLKPSSLVLTGVAATLLAVESSATALAPFLHLTVDGSDQIPIPFEPSEKGWTIPSVSLGSENDGWMVEIGGTLNPDPSIAYGIAVTDFGAPSVFGFFFGVPIVPTGSPNLVSGSLVGGLTDLTGDGVSLTPTGLLVQTSDLSAPLTTMGVDVGAPFVVGAGSPGAFYAYGPFSAGPTPGPGPGPWTFLSVSTGFGLSGGGDVAALTGFAEIVPVPEVSGGAITGGVALLAGLALRRKMRRSGK